MKQILISSVEELQYLNKSENHFPKEVNDKFYVSVGLSQIQHRQIQTSNIIDLDESLEVANTISTKCVYWQTLSFRNKADAIAADTHSDSAVDLKVMSALKNQARIKSIELGYIDEFDTELVYVIQEMRANVPFLDDKDFIITDGQITFSSIAKVKIQSQRKMFRNSIGELIPALDKNGDNIYAKTRLVAFRKGDKIFHEDWNDEIGNEYRDRIQSLCVDSIEYF